jgi:hypothetical protein
VSVLALVAGLSGVNVVTAESPAIGSAVGSADLYGTRATGASFGSGEGLRAIVTGAPAGLYDDKADNDNEAEEEEGQEDGLLPSGQAEQRAQALGDKAESKEEDHENGN